MLSRPTSPNRWTLILLMLSASGAVHHPTTIGAFLNEIGDDFEVTDALVGQLGTVTFGSSFLVAIVLAPFIGRLELGRVLWVALVILGAMGLLTAVSPSFALLFPIRGVAGIAGGVLWGTSMAAVGRAWTDPETRKSRIGFVIGALAGGPAIITPILRIIGDAASWEVAVMTHAIFYIGVGLLLVVFMPVLPGVETKSARLIDTYKAALSVVTIPRVGLPLTQRLSSQVLLNVLTTFLAGFLAAQYLNGKDWIGPAFAVLAFGFMALSFMSGRIMSLLGSPMNAVSVGTVLTIAMATALAWLTPTPIVSTLFVMLFGMSVGVYFTGLTALIMDGAGEKQGIAVFVDGAFGPMGGLFGSAIGGVAVAASADYFGWKWLMTILALLLLIPLFATYRSVANGRTGDAVGGT